jgi:putative adenylate-forming enzyme
MPLTEAVSSFATTLWVSRSAQSRHRFERWQQRALGRWLANAVPKVSAYQGFSGSITDLPKNDKASLMGNFASFNFPGFTDVAVRDAMQDTMRLDGFLVGASTGTSGKRGLFVISDRERFRWLGSILAKTVADMLWRRQRVAIILPQGGALYDSANRLRRFELEFFDLVSGPEAWRRHLERFDPTVIVAPPKVLRFMVEEGFEVFPERVFSGAETLDPTDRVIIEAKFGAPLRQIYMASEGLLGVTCPHGTLHLAEDSVFFEFEEVGEGLVNPLISSFRRDTQILARYRMNDLLRLSPEPCTCGSPLLAVDEVVGRMDDCFLLNGPESTVMITPDVLRNALLDAHHSIDDFRLIQTTRTDLELYLKEGLDAGIQQAAKEAIAQLLLKRGLSPKITLHEKTFDLQLTAKLRRVEQRLPK